MIEQCEPEDNGKLKGMKERDDGNPLDDMKQEMVETSRGDEEGDGDSGCCEDWTVNTEGNIASRSLN